MPTYKVTNEDSIWHGGNVTRIQRVTDAQDVVNAVGAGVGFLVNASQNAEYRRLFSMASRAMESLNNDDYANALRLAEELTYTTIGVNLGKCEERR